MIALYFAASGTVFFLILTILSFFNKRFGFFVSASKHPLFILPLIAFFWMLSFYLYIPFMGVGCSYAERQDLIQPENFSSSRKSGILLLPIEGFGDCRVTVTMNNGKTYSAESYNNIFALVLPAGSGKVREILMSDNVSKIQSGIKFVINSGKLTYVGSIHNPKGLISLLLPGMACKAADLTYETSSDSLRMLLGEWVKSNRLVLTAPIKDRLAQLQRDYNSACKFVGIRFGYIPFISTSLDGKVQTMAPDEVEKQYKKYEFLTKLLGNNH